MPRTGRELTLFGIYGEPKGLKTTHSTKEKPRCRPIRPKTAKTKFSPRNPLSKSAEERKQVSEQTTTQEEATAETNETVEKRPRDEEDIRVEAPVVRDLPVEQVEAVRAETSATGRTARSPVRRDVPTDQQPPSTVVSVYGDGFIEVLPHESSLNHLTGPFSIKIRIFKAAEELKDLAQVQSEESRHQHPELNDDGTFVRWSCCGSCDPNVYGCPVASSSESGNMPIEESLRLFPPRLLAVKQAKPDTDDTLSFIIFDRGVPHQTVTQNLPTAHAGCRVWWRGYECWANRYDVPSNQWLDFAIVFDGRYLRLYIDEELADSATISRHRRAPTRDQQQTAGRGVGLVGSTNSIWLGGFPRYSVPVSRWRDRTGFVGMIARAELWNVAEDVFNLQAYDEGSTVPPVVCLVSTDVGSLRDISKAQHKVSIHRNIFWRKVFPPAIHNGQIAFLDNFYHGAHNDISHRSGKSFENLLLTVVQVGNVRVHIRYSRDFAPSFGVEHGCRTLREYEIKCAAVIRGIEALSPLLTVIVYGQDHTAHSGSFEICIELTRSVGSSPVVIPLHSMLSTSYFPNVEDIRNKIIAVVSHEARRSPGEEVHQQAFRYFLALAEQSRDSRERTFLEAVMNRRVVITEKRIASEFQRIGFHVAWHELHELIRCFKTLQDNYMRNQHRIEDIPSMSLSKPSPEGAYSLPLLRQVSFSSIAPCNPESGKAKWRFTAVFLDYDLQLLDFVHDGCPTSPLGSATYTQGRYLNGGFVDRVNINLAELPSNVYCILLSLVSEHGDGMQPNTKFQKPPTTVTRRPSMKNTQQDGSNGALPIRMLTPDVLVQFENLETYHCLSRFKVRPSLSCRWFTLAALYRSRKANLWRLQALGTSGQANTIHTSLEELNTTLVEKHIVQVYEVVILYDETDESSEFSAFAKQFSRNIRFGRNGRIVINGNQERESRRLSVLGVHGGASLDISLSLLTHGTSVTVYRHDKCSSTLPTIQSICRSILRILAEHGIKESLQQNPFGATSKNVKRMVNIRVMSDQSNTPIRNAHVFVEKSLNNLKIATSLASKIVPTLTMGSRLVSIRKRLQKKKYLDEVTAVATEMIAEVIRVGLLNTYILLHRESRLMPVVRARAMLKRVMRRRYEWNKQRILARVDESERSRIYSRSKPIRLQQLYRFELQLSKSEKDLLIDFSTLDEQSLRLHCGLTAGATVKGDSESVDQIWHSQLRPAEEPTESVKKPEENKKPDKENPTANQDSQSGPQIKQKRSSLTDEHGVVTCRLAPGSYSVYIFHADYFEWTSLIVIFPSINASGLYGGSISSLAPQEIVVPLEEYRWAYSVQLVDFYQQKTTQPVGDVPLVITDKCSSEQSLITTNQDGCATWYVKKGLYAITAQTQHSCILYSGSKNVIVDGARYQPPRSVFLPVLMGKVTIEVVLGSVFGDVGAPAEVRFLENDGTVQERDGEKYGNTLAKKIQSMDIGSSCMFQLRVGTYHVHVVADGLYASNQLMKVSWNAAPLHVRHLVLLCPEFKDENGFRLVFSCVNATASMDTILEVYENGKLVRSHWQHDVSNVDDGVIFHGAHVLANCAYQTFSLTCRRGISYRMKIASSVCAHALIGSARPCIQVYTSCGLLFDRTLEDDEKWIQDFYWSPCGWDEHGVFHAEDESKEACDPK